MTVSELIVRLEAFKQKHGDLPVVTTVIEPWGMLGELRDYRTDEISLDLDERPAERESPFYDRPERNLPDGPYLRIDQDEI